MRKWFRFLLVALVVTAGLSAISAYVLVYAPVTAEFQGKRSVEIPPGSDILAVADSLGNRGILEKRRSFLLFARLSGWGTQVKAGHYMISSGSSSKDILDRLRRGLQEPVRVSVPAGSRKERIAAAIARNMAFSAGDVLAALTNEQFAAELDTDTTQLFGFLLPDTYFFYWLTSPENVIRKIKATTDALIESETGENSPGMTSDEVLRLAAIVEWETAQIPEKATIAGVYLNRIKKGWPLQADPTVQYAVMLAEGKKRRLLFADYDIRHPYNTYKYRGLPPGPINNPGFASLRAALYPADVPYLYFVANGDGSHTFSRNLREHLRAKSRFDKVRRQARRKQTEG